MYISMENSKSKLADMLRADAGGWILAAMIASV